MPRWTTIATLALTLCVLAPHSLAVAQELPLVLREDFEQGAKRWKPLDAKSWKVSMTPEGQVYSLIADSDYKPQHRSPVNIALLEDIAVSNFVLDAKLQSTVPDYGHRSLVLVFGYQDPDHYYYVHFGKQTDAHANQIFIVNGAPRVKISTKTTPGTPWDDAWHRVRIDRDTTSGAIAVYFDDMQEPVMTAIDKTFAWGGMGIGAFDDLGNFDDIELHGTAVERPAANK